MICPHFSLPGPSPHRFSSHFCQSRLTNSICTCTNLRSPYLILPSRLLSPHPLTILESWPDWPVLSSTPAHTLRIFLMPALPHPPSRPPLASPTGPPSSASPRQPGSSRAVVALPSRTLALNLSPHASLHPILLPSHSPHTSSLSPSSPSCLCEYQDVDGT